MKYAFPFLSLLLALAAACPAIAETAGEREGLGVGSSLGFDSGGSLNTGFQLDLPGFGAVLGMEGKAQGLLLKAGLEGPGLVLGPARLRGASAFLASPASQSAISLVPGPFSLDRGLSSTLQVLAIGGGGLWAYAAGRNSLPGFLAALPGLPEGAGGVGTGDGWGRPGLPSTSALGLVASLGQPGSPCALAVSASRAAPDRPSEGWQLASLPEAGGSALGLGLASQARGQAWRTAYGLGLSWAELAGLGLAMRLEAETLHDALRLSLRAGVASPSYRGPAGAGATPAASLALDARLALWPGGALGLALRAVRASLQTSLWDAGLGGFPERSLRASFVTPLGEGASLRAALACGLKASGTAFFEPSLALSLDERASSVSISLGASGLEEAGKPREPLAFHAALSARAAVAPWLSVMASLALDAGGPGGKAPTMGSTIRLKLPLSPQGQDGRAGSLGLSLDWKAMSLVVLQQGGEGPVPTLGLSWSSSLHLPLSGPGP